MLSVMCMRFALEGNVDAVQDILEMDMNVSEVCIT